MPIPNSLINNKTDESINSYIAAKDLISLNDVFKESMKKLQAEVDKLNLVVRCDSLPSIEANKKQMELLFDTLISLLSGNPPQGSRLFLYVDCNEEKNEVMDLSLKQDSKNYMIRFHTNIPSDMQWKEKNAEALSRCSQILSACNGTFAVNNVAHTGCLFSLTLPGKFH